MGPYTVITTTSFLCISVFGVLYHENSSCCLKVFCFSPSRVICVLSTQYRYEAELHYMPPRLFLDILTTFFSSWLFWIRLEWTRVFLWVNLLGWMAGVEGLSIEESEEGKMPVCRHIQASPQDVCFLVLLPAVGDFWWPPVHARLHTPVFWSLSFLLAWIDLPCGYVSVVSLHTLRWLCLIALFPRTQIFVKIQDLTMTGLE